MAKKKSFNDELFERLRATGLRKRTARLIADSTDSRRQPAKAVRSVIDDLRKVAQDVESRATGKASKGKSSKRSEAAKKAAQTRKRNAAKRSSSAKKGARTRAKRS